MNFWLGLGGFAGSVLFGCIWYQLKGWHWWPQKLTVYFYWFGLISGVLAVGNGFYHIGDTGAIFITIIERADWGLVARGGSSGGGKGFIALLFIGLWQPISIIIGGLAVYMSAVLIIPTVFRFR